MSRAATVRCRALPRARAAAPWRPVHRVSARRAHNHTPSRQHSHPPLSLQAEGRARTHTRTTDPLWHSVALQPRRSFQPQHIPPALPAGTPTVPARCGWAPIAHGPWGSWATNILKAQQPPSPESYSVLCGRSSARVCDGVWQVMRARHSSTAGGGCPPAPRRSWRTAASPARLHLVKCWSICERARPSHEPCHAHLCACLTALLRCSCAVQCCGAVMVAIAMMNLNMMTDALDSACETRKSGINCVGAYGSAAAPAARARQLRRVVGHTACLRAPRGPIRAARLLTVERGPLPGSRQRRGRHTAGRA